MPFHRFPDLPPEIRNHIWIHSLPVDDEAVLGFYNMGAWQPRQLAESDEGYDPSKEDNLNLEFRHDLLDKVHVKVALAFVSREARAVALRYACQHGIETCFREDIQGHVFVRAFRPAQETLYVPLDSWDDFCREPRQRELENDMFYHDSVVFSSWVTRLAIHEAVFWSDTFSVLRVLNEYFSIETLLLVVDHLPDEQLEDGSMKMQRRWLTKKTGKVSLVWDPRCGGSFSPCQRSDKPLKDWLKRINKAIADARESMTLGHFEIHSVSVARA